MTTTLDVALSLAQVAGWHVFPINADGSIPVRWGTAASDDPDQIRAWFEGKADRRIGVHCGLSRLVVVDRDRHGEKDGFVSLEQAGRDLPKTFHYTSRSGNGRHDVYRAPKESAPLTIAADVHGMSGVDIRAGVGMVAYNGPLLTEEPKLAKAPGWACVTKRDAAAVGSATPAEVEEWIAAERKSKPSDATRALVEAIPLDGAGNHDLLTLLLPIASSLADGRGRAWAVEAARERWTRHHPDRKQARAFDRALAKAIARVRAEELTTLDWSPVNASVTYVDHDPEEWAANEKAQRRSVKKHAVGSWALVDVSEVLEGIVSGSTPPERPLVLDRGDGQALFYAGRRNGVHGESGSGKSWLALLAAAQELAAGHACLYIDYEDGARGIVQRLVDLGTDPSAIAERFHYVNPDQPFTDAAAKALKKIIRRRSVTLVVVDSTGEGMAADGTSPNDDDDVARWFKRVPTFLARLGPAVVVLDHSPKATDLNSRLWPIGSQRKRAAIDGAQYLQEAAQPFSRDNAGWAKIICAKDRHGTYARAEHVASLHVTPTGSGVHVELVAPPKVTPVDKRAALMERISATLETMGAPLTMRALRDHVKGNASEIAEATRELVARGFIEVHQVGQSLRHHHVKRFSQPGTAVTSPLDSAGGTDAVPLRAGTAEPVSGDGSGTGQEPVGTGAYRASRKTSIKPSKGAPS